MNVASRRNYKGNGNRHKAAGYAYRILGLQGAGSPFASRAKFTLFNAINLQGSWEICSRQAATAGLHGEVGKDMPYGTTRTWWHLPRVQGQGEATIKRFKQKSP